MEDKFLLEIYMQGFDDELNGDPEKIFSSELLKRAYLIGRMDAIAGDESEIVDYQTEETNFKSHKTNKITMENLDAADIKLRTLVFQMFKSGDNISISLIQRKCAVGYNTAARVFENLIEDGLIEKPEGNGVWIFV